MKTSTTSLPIVLLTLTALFGVCALAPAASIHGMKWDDRNGNATRDPSERPLPGVTI